jgi:hypothetical protein
MSSQSHENEQPESLSEQVMARCREVFDIFQELGKEIPSFYDPLETAAANSLKKALGYFALDKMQEGHKPTEVVDLERPALVTERAASWFSEELRILTAKATYEAFYSSQREEIANLLHGKIITARSLDGRNFATSNGIMDSVLLGGHEITEHSGPFLGYIPNAGKLHLGEPREQVIVSLFDLLTNEQIASIEIHETVEET